MDLINPSLSCIKCQSSYKNKRFIMLRLNVSTQNVLILTIIIREESGYFCTELFLYGKNKLGLIVFQLILNKFNNYVMCFQFCNLLFEIIFNVVIDFIEFTFVWLWKKSGDRRILTKYPAIKSCKQLFETTQKKSIMKLLLYCYL
jgi:hypothetical protein